MVIHISDKINGNRLGTLNSNFMKKCDNVINKLKHLINYDDYIYDDVINKLKYCQLIPIINF